MAEKSALLKPQPQPPTQCSVCDAPCSQSCGLCKKASYCSKEHQKCDYRRHKINCFPAIIKWNEEFGRHFVATRDILRGELIFREKPLVSGPSGRDGLFPVCLACYRIIQSNYTCSKCKWPVCNIKCENDPVHCDNECGIFRENNVQAFTADDIHLYEKIIVLRAILLKEKNPKAWEKVADLQSHLEARRATLKGCLLSNSAIQFVRETCNLTQFSDKDIDHVLGALGTNAFSSEDSVSCWEYFRCGSYLFYNASIPAHNCIANSSWTIQSNSEYQLRASVDIPGGEAITQLYTQSFTGTLERRKHLKQTKYFSCSCSRCASPSELNTFFSALVCPTCGGKGILLPRDSLKEDSDWICGNDTCKKSKRVQEIQKCVSDVRTDIDHLPQENSCEAIAALEKTLKKYKSVVLHENHHLIYQLENDIMQRISFILTLNSTNHKLNRSKSNELAERLINLSRKNLTVVDKFAGGISRHRGRLLYFIQQGTQLRILNQLNSKSKLPQNMKMNSDLKTEIDELIKIRREAGLMFENEPESREEYYLLQFLREYSKDMQIILRHYGSGFDLEQ